MSVTDLVAQRVQAQRQILINPANVEAHKTLSAIEQQVHVQCTLYIHMYMYMYIVHNCTCACTDSIPTCEMVYTHHGKNKRGREWV